MSAATELRPPAWGDGEWYVSQAVQEDQLVATGKGVVHSIYATNSNAAARWLYVFDGTDDTGDVIAGPFQIPTTDYVSVFLQYGKEFSTGLYVAVSSTQDTFTAAGADEHRFNVGWKPLSRRDYQ
jgi:hypothetical protein